MPRSQSPVPAVAGLGVRLAPGQSPQAAQAQFDALQARLGLAAWCDTHWESDASGPWLASRLGTDAQSLLCPDFDTLHLRRSLALHADPAPQDELMRETWAALLCAPVRIDFDSLEALESHLRVRCNIARAAEKTALAFKTSDAAERPEAYWHYREDVGFLLKPGLCLVEALVAATQPERTGRLYDFSCYRATEYVILLGLSQEAQRSYPQFYAQLQASAEETCIKSGRFHDVFLVEYGSMDAPIPQRYYVPGDRVWFKNPDPHSSDASGYEGSWVIYMGGGLFSNFWKQGQPYTLEAKSLEVYHWRDAAYRDAQAELQIDESVVEARVRATEADPALRGRVLDLMNRYRDPTGVYGSGGCMDATREFPRQLGRIALG